MLPLLVWPKLITLGGFYCIFIRRGYYCTTTHTWSMACNPRPKWIKLANLAGLDTTDNFRGGSTSMVVSSLEDIVIVSTVADGWQAFPFDDAAVSFPLVMTTSLSFVSLASVVVVSPPHSFGDVDWIRFSSSDIVLTSHESCFVTSLKKLVQDLTKYARATGSQRFYAPVTQNIKLESCVPPRGLKRKRSSKLHKV